MNYILGLDLGITSVGFGIIDEDYNVIDYGVRLFDEGNADKNLKRRTMRKSRRLRSRRKNRINAIKYLLLNNNIIESLDFEILDNVYELRCKGLNEKLTKLELANVLVNLAKRRGSSLEVVIDENDKEGAESKSSLSKNSNELRKRNMYVCELQLERYKIEGKLRDHTNIFSTDDYKKELEKILSNQQLGEELNDRIINIIIRRRLYSQGPGSLKFPTQYGSYRYVEENGIKLLKNVNLLDEMRGKCSVFKDEKRISKMSYEACLFNLLNDLNNVTYVINGEKNKISKEIKIKIIDYVLENGNITVKQLYKLLNVPKEDVLGLRINKKHEQLLTSFDGYNKFKKNGIKLNVDEIDMIIDVLTKTLIVGERIKEIKELKLNLSDEEINIISNFSGFNGYHSLSKKAMDLIIPEMIETSDNQMQVLSKMNIGKIDYSKYSNEIAFNDEAILSPVAKRVHRQAIKLTNELRKKYGEFKTIVIETTRDKNSDDRIKRIKDIQRKFEEQNKNTDVFLVEYGLEPTKINLKTKLKIRLYNEQEGKSMYSGAPIDLDLLINDPTAYEIEHIIPYAVSFDNSLQNKCLVSKTENQIKGKNTPWGYFSTGRAIGPNDTFEKYKGFVEGLKISRKKKNNLLNQDDISEYDNMEQFKARNLIDTSYGIRTVMASMKDYFNATGICTNVVTVKGSVTHLFRTKAKLDEFNNNNKDRDFFIHHAIDGLIIAGIANQRLFKEVLNYNKEDGIDFNNDPLEDGIFLSFVNNLKRINGTPFDFSYKVDRKTNRQFSDETIYSTRIYDDVEYVVKKYKDIYSSDGEKLAKLFNDEKSEKLLMFKNDVKTYDILKKVYEFYKNEKNPFAKYKEEHNECIKKYSKSGKGSDIVSVKYVDSKLGNYIDITGNYKTKNKKVVLLQISPYRTDIYQDSNGIYKFVTVRRNLVKNFNEKNVIDKIKYNEMLKEKGIDFNSKFLFSLNRNDVIKYQTIKMNRPEYYLFTATNDDKANKIEVKLVTEKTQKQKTISIGKSVTVLEKYNVSILGEYQKVNSEDLKFEW